MKNINLAVLIAAAVFGIKGPNGKFGVGVLFVLLLYGGINLAVAARAGEVESPAVEESWKLQGD